MEQLTPITQYTSKFLSSDFTNYINQFVEINITDLLHTTKIPAMPVSGLVAPLLTQIYNLAVSNTIEFQNTISGSLFNNWYSQPRSSGWSELAIIESVQRYRYQLLHDRLQTIDKPDSTVTKNQRLKNLCQDLLTPLNIKIQSLRLMKLQPQGWVRPHIDRSNFVNGLCYFWIPLHDFNPCLKVFPFGWLQHQFGNMYLFNQNSYIHAVHNDTDQDRYVMIGRFDPMHVPEQLLTQYENFKLNFLKIWRSTN